MKKIKNILFAIVSFFLIRALFLLNGLFLVKVSITYLEVMMKIIKFNHRLDDILGILLKIFFFIMYTVLCLKLSNLFEWISKKINATETTRNIFIIVVVINVLLMFYRFFNADSFLISLFFSTSQLIFSILIVLGFSSLNKKENIYNN
jgi:hypothetical protein